jgi:hypothetical protein
LIFDVFGQRPVECARSETDGKGDHFG